MSALPCIKASYFYAEPDPARLRAEQQCRDSWRDLSLPLPLPEAQVIALCKIATHLNFKGANASSCLIAIFTGQDAAGKLMAAEALAYEVQRTLYRIDLSEIGEFLAEDGKRRLTQMVAAARTENAILIIDNADDLPGPLLKLLAAYSGLSILMTDASHERSSPMYRSAHYVVDFPFQTETE
ncbi:AAA family ATPase [Alloacidobacterium dinghuense]|uniref:AAA family ATPase n=1 Tax=Alloacidobacterium dinghuense TaxID=2763107 RepID=A0A7G8BNR5_9BACT|nr:AAA family ATPase [Alloacidobacterium dinghuense]QNI34185.1 AAA family ATPase [Alloacidobacterium dinghuense]